MWQRVSRLEPSNCASRSKLTLSDDADSIQTLERVTRESLDNEKLRLLFVSCQICNVNQKIDAAITETIHLCKNSTRVAAFPSPFSAVAGTSIASVVLCDIILNCFRYAGIDGKILNTILRDLTWSSLDSHTLSILGYGALALCDTAVGFVVGGPLGALVLLGMSYLASVPGFARAVLMCACDIILMLERAFWYTEKKIVPD